ncbi:MAG: YbgF trimerization domain-containing protein, partial [Granulosicoccaceae bacterium]
MAVFKRTRAALLVGVVVGLTSVQVAEAAKSLPIETRVQRLERMLDNRVLIQLLQRIESLQQEVRELRGQVELQTNEMEAMNKRNRDLYLDTETSALVETPAPEPQTEKALYDQAYMDLVNGRYSAAASGFRGVLSKYPEGEWGDNSRYWLGETYYVERKFDEARAQFEAIVE